MRNWCMILPCFPVQYMSEPIQEDEIKAYLYYNKELLKFASKSLNYLKSGI